MKNIIFVHGGPGFEEYLEDYIGPFLKKRSPSYNFHFYQQHLYDDVTIQQLLEQLDEKIESLEGEKILFGHSWGPVLCLEYLKQFPNKVDALIMLNSGIWHGHWNEIYEEKKKELGITGEDHLSIYAQGSDQNIAKNFLEKAFAGFNETSFLSLDETYIKNYDHREFLGKLDIPVINIYGDLDVRFPIEESRRIKNYSEKLLDYELKRAGHFTFLNNQNLEDIFYIIEKDLKL